jgi:Type II secretion system (T2SS), protein G
MRRLTIASGVLLVVAICFLSFIPLPTGHWKLDMTLSEVWYLREHVELLRGEANSPRPTSDPDLRALIALGPPFLERMPPDLWGHPYVYRQSPNGDSFALYSVGVNGVDEGGAGDDITGPSKLYSCSEYGINCPLQLEDILRVGVAASATLALLVLLVCSGVFLYRRVHRRAA